MLLPSFYGVSLNVLIKCGYIFALFTVHANVMLGYISVNNYTKSRSLILVITLKLFLV